MVKIKTFKSNENLQYQIKKVLKAAFMCSGQLMLSGGKTPYSIYNQIGKEKYKVHSDCKIFLSDERCVSYNSIDNNANNLLPMLNSLNIENQFIRIKTDINPVDSANDYANELKYFDNVHLGLLGIGLDGHTAGIFPNNSNNNTKMLTLSAKRPDGYYGVSVSPIFIKKIKKIIMLVAGIEKKQILKNIKNNPTSTPAGRIVNSHQDAEIWTDIMLKD